MRKTKTFEEYQLNEGNMEADYVKKFGDKMTGSSLSTAKGWVDGIGGISKKQRSSIWDKIKDKYYSNINESNEFAIFQEKKDGKFIGDKIYYYETKNPKWWFISIGKEYKEDIPEYGSSTGEFLNRKQFPNIKALIKHHEDDNIVKI